MPPESDTSIRFLAPKLGVYIPPSAPIEIYTSHAETVDEMWRSSGVSGLSLSGTVNDNVKAISDVYPFLYFSQNNSIRNQIGSLLDLVFTFELDIDVDTTPNSLVKPDKYYQLLSITYSMPDVPPKLDDPQSFRNFNCADFNSITNILSFINWETIRLQKILITLIEQYVPIYIFRRSIFPIWAIPKLKKLIIDKKTAHKNLKQFGTMHYRHKFALLRAQVKLESRLAYESYLSKINTSLQNDPHIFWSFINNRRNTLVILSVMHYGDIIASDVDIASLFALLFKSNAEKNGIKPFTFLPSRLTIELDEIEENVLSLRTTKSRGPYGTCTNENENREQCCAVKFLVKLDKIKSKRSKRCDKFGERELSKSQVLDGREMLKMYHFLSSTGSVYRRFYSV
ncbi:hypothetical protein QTP88_026768 [Uroleucon formosanum]